MSEHSLLVDPVFLLTWQLHLSVVALFAVLAVWAGMTRWRWYLAHSAPSPTRANAMSISISIRG